MGAGSWELGGNWELHVSLRCVLPPASCMRSRRTPSHERILFAPLSLSLSPSLLSLLVHYSSPSIRLPRPDILLTVPAGQKQPTLPSLRTLGLAPDGRCRYGAMRSSCLPDGSCREERGREVAVESSSSLSASPTRYLSVPSIPSCALVGRTSRGRRGGGGGRI